MEKIHYFIRHAESQANATGLYQGQSYDTDLSYRGRQQAVAAAEILEQEQKITAIIASPLRRTWQTAAIINQRLQVPMIIDQRLLEINHGTWEGKAKRQFTPDEVRIWQIWKTDPGRCQMPEGEHFHEVVSRVDSFLVDLQKKTGRMAIVTHDLILRIIIAKIGGLPFANIWELTLDNCGITTLTVNPNKLVKVNKNHHLVNLRSEVSEQML